MADQLTVGQRVRIANIDAEGNILRVAFNDMKRKEYLVEFVSADGTHLGTRWFTADALAPVAA